MCLIGWFACFCTAKILRIFSGGKIYKKFADFCYLWGIKANSRGIVRRYAVYAPVVKQLRKKEFLPIRYQQRKSCQCVFLLRSGDEQMTHNFLGNGSKKC